MRQATSGAPASAARFQFEIKVIAKLPEDRPH
jgi:hypothetical protein